MKRIPLFGLGLLLFIMSCASDNQSDTTPKTNFDETLLAERWEVDRAFRNGKIAASLDDLFFDFTRTDSLTTNIMGHGITEPFNIVGDSIKTIGESNMYFVVTKLDSSQLTLETNMRATPFRFLLKPGEIASE